MSDRACSVPQKCLACDAELRSPIVCQDCHKLYPIPKSVDYFELLGLDHRYDIDLSRLDDRFLSVSRHIHPDYFTNAGEEMGHLSTRLSAEINEALKVLKDPVLRAGYMLELSGGPSASDDRSVPPEILSESVMLREEIEQATADGDGKSLDSLRKRVEERGSQLLSRIRELAKQLPNASDDEKSSLRQALNSMKYYNNMLDLLWNS